MTTPAQASSANAAPCGRIDATTHLSCPIRVIRPPMTIELIRRIDALYGSRPCPAHATANDRALAEVIDSAWAVGHRYGMLVKAGRAPATPYATEEAPAAQSATQSSVASQLNAITPAAKPATTPAPTGPRERDLRGRQFVIVAVGTSKYTYHWADPHGEGDLHPGDTVLLPPNQVEPTPHEAVIESIGSSYQGTTRAVLYLVRRANPAS